MPSDALARFVQEVQSRYAPEKPETFWSCEQPLRQLLAGGLVQRWLNDQLRMLLKDPLHAGDWNARELTLHRARGWTLSVALFDAPQRFIHALSFLAFYAPLASPLTADRYGLPQAFRSDVFDPGLRVEPAGGVSASAGELMRLETDRFAYDFQIRQPQPVLRLTSSSLRHLEWLFSKSTLQAWQANDAELSSTQLRVAAYVLGKISHHSSIPPLKQLSSHPHHAVRWAAIQNLGRLSRSEALIKIREAVNDAHPHVRRAAQKTLDQLERRTPR